AGLAESRRARPARPVRRRRALGVRRRAALADADQVRRCMRRAFVIVLDACGVGALPDAADYGDDGTNTLGHLAEQLGGLRLPALARLGLGSIIPLKGMSPAAEPVVHGRLHPLGPGKDSTAGHRELMGLVASRRPPTYPDGFPDEVLDVV